LSIFAYAVTCFSEQEFGAFLCSGDSVSLRISFYQGDIISLCLSCFPALGVSGEGYKRGSKAMKKRRKGSRKERPEQEKEGNR